MIIENAPSINILNLKLTTPAKHPVCATLQYILTYINFTRDSFSEQTLGSAIKLFQTFLSGKVRLFWFQIKDSSYNGDITDTVRSTLYKLPQDLMMGNKKMTQKLM